MSQVDVELNFTAFYRHPVETVWAALTDREALRTWFLDTDFEPRVGKAFSVRGPYISHVNCVVIALDPPSRMEWSWQSAELLIPTRVIFTLAKSEGGTRLTIQHIGTAHRYGRGHESGRYHSRVAEQAHPPGALVRRQLHGLCRARRRIGGSELHRSGTKYHDAHEEEGGDGDGCYYGRECRS